MNDPFMTPEIIEKWTRRGLLMPDYTLGDVDFSLRCPLDNGRHTLRPEQDLGKLGRLPPEILITAVLSLDVLSLTVFRRVNKAAMVFVDSVPQYRMVYRHSPNILRSVLVIEARHFDFRTLFNALCESRCALCGEFSGYLYLITCLRVCYLCFTEDSSQLFLPVRRKQASAILGCPEKKLQQLPHIRSVGGRYADNALLRRARTTLWDRRSILSSSHGRASGREKSDRHCNDPRRFMAIIPAPYFLPPSNEAFWGIYCLGCRESHDHRTYFRRQYTKQGFVDHIIKYGPVILGKAEDRPSHQPPVIPG